MADRYVWSGATGANNGTSWADAFTTLAGAAAVDAAGDTMLVADDHDEITNAAVALAWNGSGVTPATTTRVLCVNRTTGARSSGAVVKTGAGTNFHLDPHSNGASNLIAGIRFISGVGATARCDIRLGQLNQPRPITWRDCVAELQSTAASFLLLNGPAGNVLENFWVKLPAPSSIGPSTVFLEWIGGGVESGSACTTLFAVSGNGFQMRASALDLSALPTTALLVNCNARAGTRVVFRKCLLPTGWTGTLSNLPPGAAPQSTAGSRVAMYECDSADATYRMQIDTGCGAIYADTAVSRTGGAETKDATPVGLSWRMVTNAGAALGVLELDTDPISYWEDTPGTPRTATIEVAHNLGTALTNAELRLEVEYPGSAGYTTGSLLDNGLDTVFDAPTTLASSSETWTGLTTPTKQKLSVTYTPQTRGLVNFRVIFVRPSSTIYVCPGVDIT